MTGLQDLIRGFTKPGQVAWIGLRPERRAEVVRVDRAEVAPDGLVGDRSRAGKRAVTLIQAEHLPVIAACLGVPAIAPADLRRNIVVSGLNLNAMKGRRLRVGSAEVEIGTICAPCSRMEETFGPGGYSAVRGHGGWCAQVLTPGTVAMGDAVQPVD